MKYRLIVIFMLLFSIASAPGDAPAQTRQEALAAIQTLQSRCEGGINFEGYSRALNDAQLEINAFLDQEESDFSERIERALIAFETAFALWEFKVNAKQDYVGRDTSSMTMLLDVYPASSKLFNRSGTASISEVVAFLWERADERISEAKRLVYGGGRKSGSRK